MASVKEALGSGSTERPAGELLPAELYAESEINSKRQSSSLVAVRTLVRSFVTAHSGLLSQT